MSGDSLKYGFVCFRLDPMPWDVHPTFSVNGAPPLLYILIFAEQEQNGILKSIIRHRGNNYSQTFMIIYPCSCCGAGNHCLCPVGTKHNPCRKDIEMQQVPHRAPFLEKSYNQSHTPSVPYAPLKERNPEWSFSFYFPGSTPKHIH